MIFTYQVTGHPPPPVTFPPEDIDLNQRAVGICEALGAESYRIQPVLISSWAPESLPMEPFYIGSVIFLGLISTVNPDGVAVYDAYEVRTHPEACLRAMVEEGGLVVGFDYKTWVFVDPDNVVPPEENPIGDIWPEHYMAKPPHNRKMYHTAAAPAFTPQKYPMGTIDNPQTISQADGTYTLFQWWEKTGTGSGLPGSPQTGVMKYAWEKTYSK